MGGFLEPAKRRDVAGLRVSLGELVLGETATVVCTSARYGDVEITGRLRESLAGDLAIGGRAIGGQLGSLAMNGGTVPVRQPTGELRSVERAPDERLRGEEIAIGEIGHGDLVSVDFAVEPHGEFTIVGVATEGKDRFLLVGEWIIRDADDQAPRVARVRRVGRFGEHLVPAPSRREPLSVG